MKNLDNTFKNINITTLTKILNKIYYFKDKIDFFNNFYLGNEGVYHTKDGQNNSTIFEILKKYSIDVSDLIYAPIIEIDPASEKIHYACGNNLFKDWINVDFFDFDNTTVSYTCKKVNLIEKHPFKSNTFQYGFCEDFLEHLEQEDSLIFLSEVFRTLKKNGIVRVSFPGLEGVLKKHYNIKNNYFIGKFESYVFWDHKHFFSKEELALIAKNIGYSEINFVEYGKSNYDELRNLDTRIDQIGLNTYVELKK